MDSFQHKPVLEAEVVEVLRPRPGGVYCDGTVGGGGHASLILEKSSPSGRLIGFDQDEDALAAAASRLGRFSGRFELHRSNFADMREYLPEQSCDGVLLDLGVSSPQLDQAERGFSFQQEGPLDMRMDRRQGTTAADIVNGWTATELGRIFWELGAEKNSRRIARAIEKRRLIRKFQTTSDLAETIAREIPRRGQKTHPATRVFQALRITVNRELEVLENGLKAAWAILKPGGMLAVITFHSLEDRIVKEFGRALSRDYDFPGERDIPELRVDRPPRARWFSKKAIQPTISELKENPRARSAQLRALQKLGGEL